MSSLFDPQAFLDSNVEIEGAMATKIAIPPPHRYQMQIKNLVARKVIPDDPAKKPFSTLEVECVISGDQLTPDGRPLKEITGRDENVVRYKTFLDFTEGGTLALGEGMNVGLGRLRAATNQNNPSQKWSFGMLRGQVFNGEVYHVQDKKDAEKFYAEVKNPLPNS